MCNWKQWFLPGLLTVALLSALALWVKTSVIESDLLAKSNKTLEENGYSWVSVKVDGRDAIVTGLAPSEESQSLSASVVDATYDVRLVDNRTDLMAAQSPYIVTADRAGNAVIVSGYAPDELTRAKIITAAEEAMPSAEVVNEIELARGAPQNFVEITKFGFNQLAGLSSGRVNWSDQDLTISGVARDQQSYNSINTALSGVFPRQSKLAASDILAPVASPYTWAAHFEGSKITLTGHVPSEAIRQNLAQSARAVLPTATIVDEMFLASGEPETFNAAGEFSLQQLARFSNGSVTISDLELTIRGVALDAESYTIAKQAVSATLPAGLSLAQEAISPATVSPYRWAANYTGNDIILTGFVPTAAAREEITARAKSILPGALLKDQMQTADGAPPEFLQAVSFTLSQLSRFVSGAVALSDLELSVEGVARDSNAFDEARAELGDALPAYMTLASGKIDPPTISPYQWSAEYDGKALILDGFVPGDDARGAALKFVSEILPQAAVEDRMQTATGEPKRFSKAAEFALVQMKRFGSGFVSLSDLDLTVRGTAIDPGAYSAARNSLSGDLPLGLKLSKQDVKPARVSPYTWSASYDGSNVVLQGFVPDEATRKEVATAMGKTLPAAKITDRTMIAAGAPESYGAATSVAIGVFSRFSQGNVALTDLDLVVSGTAKSPAIYSETETYLADALPGNMNLKASDIRPPAATGEYLWQASMSADAVVLEGSAPSREARAQIEERAKDAHPKKRIDNRLVIETGARESFVLTASNMLEILSNFSNGDVRIKGASVDVSGEARTVVSYETALEAISGEVGAGFYWGKKNVLPATVSPYSWWVERRDRSLRVGGFVPDSDTGKKLVSNAEEKFGLSVENRQRLAAGEPEGFGNATSALITSVSVLNDAKGTITGTTVEIEGRATSESEAGRIASSLEVDLPSNFRLRKRIAYPLPKVEAAPKPEPAQPVADPELQISAPDSTPKVTQQKPEPQAAPKVAKVVPTPQPKPKAPKRCKVDFKSLFRGEKILFATARAVILDKSSALLSRIAEAAQKCEGALIEVSGHTDSRGTRRYNQALSEARASAVVAYLTRQGVPKDRLVARGYGESKPIASNRRPKTRFKNRRIEFRALEAN